MIVASETLTHAHHLMNAEEAIWMASRLLERAKELEALKHGVFTLSSGMISNFYFDGRLLSTDPESVSIISSIFVDVLVRKNIQVFGGPAVGAVPMVGTMALKAYERQFELKGFFVRPEKKDHGEYKRIEGDVGSPEDRRAVYDDTISTGKSIFRAIEAIDEEHSFQPKISMCILNREQGGATELNRRGIPLFNILIKTERDTVEVDRDTLREWFA